MLWVILTILAAFIWSTISIIDKFIVDNEMPDPLLVNTISGVLTFLFFTIISVVTWNFVTEPMMILSLILIGILTRVGILLYYYAVSRNDVSVVSALLQTKPLFVAIIAAVVLGELFGLVTYFGITLMVVGAMAMSHKNHTKWYKVNGYIVFALCAAVVFSLINVFISYVSLNISVWSMFLWMGVGHLIVSLIVWGVHHPHIHKKEIKAASHLCLTVIMNVMALVFMTVALTLGSPTIITALSLVEAVFTFVFASVVSFIYPKFVHEDVHKSSMIRKTVGLLLILSGVLFVF